MYLIQTGGKQHLKTDEWIGEILICGKWKPLNHKPNWSLNATTTPYDVYFAHFLNAIKPFKVIKICILHFFFAFWTLRCFFWLYMCCICFCISGQKDTQSTEASGWVGIWKTGPSCKYSVMSKCELKGIFCWVNSHLILQWLFCRRGNTTARMRMKTSMRMTLTCQVRTLTPKDESLSGICVSEKTQRK